MMFKAIKPRKTKADQNDIRIRLVLVDDEARYRQALMKRLERRGVRVLEAGNADECIELLQHQEEVDVVVSDVKMPGRSGLELLKEIKEAHLGVEVILLTGHASTMDGVEGIKAGAFDYLSKPVEFEHLLGKIRQAHDKILWREEQKSQEEFRKKVEDQMILTERLAAIGTLATGVAHEINNPLAIIRESAGWISQILAKKEMADIPRKDHIEKALGKIDASVERARRITHQLLSFQQKGNSRLMTVHLKELVEESVQLVHREAFNRNIRIIVEAEEGIAPIDSDPYQIRQVLLNLITNAIHASADGGTIRLTLKAEEGMVCLAVEDEGAGIPEKNLKKIFEPFFTTKSPGKGTGLGLFVTRGILEKLGGTMDVESQVGRGTVFTIGFPMSRNQEAT